MTGWAYKVETSLLSALRPRGVRMPYYIQSWAKLRGAGLPDANLDADEIAEQRFDPLMHWAVAHYL